MFAAGCFGVAQASRLFHELPHYDFFAYGRSRRISMLAKGWLLALVAGFVFAGLVGCGGGGSASTSVETTNASTQQEVKLLPLLDRLPGDWAGVMVIDEEGVKGLPADKVAALKAMEMGISFSPQGEMVLSGYNNGQPYESKGAWQLVKEDGQALTLRSIEGDGTQKDIVLMFDGNDRFLMPLKTEVANLGAMQFERMR